MSRNDLGKKVEGGLVEYFQQTYGPPSSEAYQKVKRIFQEFSSIKKSKKL